MTDTDADAFYCHHRGGSGAVVLVIAQSDRDGGQLFGVFGSIETARSWMDRLPKQYVSIVAPFIVDDPDWGNEAAEATQ